MPRQSSLPHDLARQSLGLPTVSSPARTPLTAPAGKLSLYYITDSLSYFYLIFFKIWIACNCYISTKLNLICTGFGIKDSEGNCQKSVFWDPVGGILLWPQEKSKLPSNYSFSADLIHRLSAPDKKVRSPASTSVSVGGPWVSSLNYILALPRLIFNFISQCFFFPCCLSQVNRQLHYLDVRRSSVPTDISLELLRRLTEQPSVPGRSSSNNNNNNNSNNNGKSRNSRVKKVLRR